MTVIEIARIEPANLRAIDLREAVRLAKSPRTEPRAWRLVEEGRPQTTEVLYDPDSGIAGVWRGGNGTWLPAPNLVTNEDVCAFIETAEEPGS